MVRTDEEELFMMVNGKYVKSDSVAYLRNEKEIKAKLGKHKSNVGDKILASKKVEVKHE